MSALLRARRAVHPRLRRVEVQASRPNRATHVESRVACLKLLPRFFKSVSLVQAQATRGIQKHAGYVLRAIGPKLVHASNTRHERGLNWQFSADIVCARRRTRRLLLEQQVALEHLSLVVLVIHQLLIQDPHERIFVRLNIVSHLLLSVAKLGHDRLHDLVVEGLVSPDWLPCREMLLVGEVLSVVGCLLCLLHANEVVDYVEIVVDYIATRHNVLVVQQHPTRRGFHLLRVAVTRL